MNTENQHSDFINFRKYYTGSMSSEEKIQFENELENDPFAKDAFEGFLLLENDFARISAIENTNMALKKKFGIESSSNVFPLKFSMAIAASLVLLIGSYFIIGSNTNSKTETFAENKVEEPIIAEEPEETLTFGKDDTLVDREVIQDYSEEGINEKLINKNLTINDFNEKKQKERKKEIVKTELISNKRVANSVQDDIEEEVEKENKDKFVFNDGLADIGNANVSKTSSYNSPTVNAVSEVSLQSATNSVFFNDNDIKEPVSLENISNYKTAIVAYNKSEYTKAIKFFNNSIAENKNISGSNFYIGMSNFNQNKTTKAIKYFDKVINSSSSLTHKAMWYKSLSLLKKGQKNEAKFILNQLVNSNSLFKNSAEKKLKTL